MKAPEEFVQANAEVATLARQRGHAVVQNDGRGLVIYGFAPWEDLSAEQQQRVRLVHACRAFQNKPEREWTSDQFLQYAEMAFNPLNFDVSAAMLQFYAPHL
jgi:hypothetical protein